MISFAQATSPDVHQRAMKAALLSTIPGLGQAYNRRLDKAIAFFLVDVVNLVFVAVLLGAKIPFVDLSSQPWLQHLSSWRAGTAPFLMVQLMILAYVVYAQWDAYQDAQNSSRQAGKPVLSLSHTTCASYILHLSTIFTICFVILLKLAPDNHPDVTQLALTFELSQPDAEQQKKERGQDVKLAEEAKAEELAHIKERAKEDELNVSTKSAEMSAKNDNANLDPKAAAQETEVVASKQIVLPDAKESPTEIASKGQSITASDATKTKVDETKEQKSQPVNAEKSNSAAAETSEQAADKLRQQEKSIMIAQLPDAAGAASTAVPKLPENTTEISARTSAGANGAGEPAKIAFASALPATGSASASAVPAAGTQAPAGTGPSMLGFMDSALSNDPDMRQVWSEMSGNISRYVKEHPLAGQGMAVTTFMLNKAGRCIDMKSAPDSGEFSSSLNDMLVKMPHVIPPAKQESKMFFQVKASKDASAQTFVSLELSSQPSQISSESLSDFKYQVDLQAYLKGIKKAVYSSWKPPVQEGIKPVMVGMKVTTDGTVTDQHVVQSSGDPKMDKAALNAALSITKWSQPPAGTAEDLDVCMVIQKCKTCDAEAAQQAGTAAPKATNAPAILHSTSTSASTELRLRPRNLKGATGEIIDSSF